MVGGQPDVSVVVGAYNAMPYLTKSLTSVLEQSIGLDRLEVIAVNDGSTDGTGAELDRFAATCPVMRVVHQENSGGPAGPRNVGIELARGRYIFFLDADDYLGVEALERMVAMADRNQSDVVLGRRVGVNRGTPQSMFRYNQDRADVFTSGVWNILSAQKLFRKSLIDRLGLRFPNLPIGQDQPFTAKAYLHADVISVLADYDCYYLVRRDDGGNNTTRQKDIRVWLNFVEHMVHLVAEHVAPGEKRDILMQRHFRDEFRRLCFSERFLDAEPEVQAEAVAQAKAIVDEFYTPRIAQAMPVDGRLRFELIRRGDVQRLAEVIQFHLAGAPAEELIEDGRVYLRYPFFRDPEVGIPDECYDNTRRSLKVEQVEWVQGSPLTLAVSSRRRLGDAVVKLSHGDTVFQIPSQRTADGGYRALVPLPTAAAGRPLPPGRWRVDVQFIVDGEVVKTVPVPRPAGRRRMLWLRRKDPAAVGVSRTGPFAILVAPLVSSAVVRAVAAAVRRRLSARK